MRGAMIAGTAAALLFAAGCGFADREAETKSIADAMRATPGVVSVDNRYGNSISLGAEFTLGVDVKHAVSAEELGGAARSFVLKVNAIGFEDYVVVLTFTDTDTSSNLALNLSDGGLPWKIALSADAVAATTSLWVHLMPAPGVTDAVITQPARNSQDPQTRDIHVYVADESAGREVERRFPEVAGRWEVRTW
jgi:hypothetical protein